MRHPEAMFTHQELPSPLSSLEHGGSLIHTVNIAPLSLLLASMDPAPTANPHAELVTECFQECPALETPTRNRSPTTPPDVKLLKGSGWGGVIEPAVDKEEDHSQEGKVADVLLDEGCEEGNVPLGSQGWLPGLAGHGGDRISQGPQTSAVEDLSRLKKVRGCTLPSLKELGLDMYVKKQY
ncbi:hypothetical protein HO173_004058 [Letharia columbiana]|uniref:Uncharacterized protein n=1 Tax=Letharia columbiana TaxID=112416 RepID=A0A8H6FZQ8_9LECA|nr:uncharacterized protein HO173_004058 [Letharia columbiana]KAF6237857.1 hypothetical protein HO173_004058 [Letharia columbiana]